MVDMLLEEVAFAIVLLRKVLLEEDVEDNVPFPAESCEGNDLHMNAVDITDLPTANVTLW